MTSGDEHSMDKHTELTNKINRLNKNVKLIMDTLNTLVQKLDVNHTEPKNDEEKEKEKEKLDKIFAKRQVGRPVGTWESKREQYANMLNEGKIKQPKEITLEYYKIVKVGDKYVMIARDED